MTTYYPSKGISLMPRKGPSVWKTHHPSAKPWNLQSFHPYELHTYDTSGGIYKYPTVVPSLVPLLVYFLYSISCHFCITNLTSNSGVTACIWITSHYFIANTPNCNLKKYKKSHYIIFFQYLLLIFMLFLSPMGEYKWIQSLVPVCASSVTSLPNYGSVPSSDNFNFKLNSYNQK